MSQGKFLSNLSFTLGLNLIIKLFWVLVIEIAVQRVLGTETYGQYFEAFNFAYIFFILLDLGISNYNNRAIAGDESRIQELYPSMLAIKIILGIVYLLVVYIVATMMSYTAEHRAIILFVAVNQSLLSLMLFLRSNVGGLHLFRTDAVLSVMDKFVMGLICAVLLFLPFLNRAFTLEDFLWAQFIGYVLAVTLGFITLLRRGLKPRFNFKRSLLKEILLKSYPFALLFFLMSLYTRIDTVMLGRMRVDGDFQTGLYASAFRILDAATIFTVLLSNLLLPMFSRMIGRKEDLAPLLKESFRVVLIVATLFPLLCAFYAPEIYAILYKTNISEGKNLFALLMLNFVPMAFGYIFGTLLTAKGDLKLLNVISLFGLVLNVAINFVLIPEYGVMGASIATILTQSLVTLSTFYFSLKYFSLRVYDFISLKVIYFVASSIGVFVLFRLLDSWMIGAALSLVLALLLSFVLKVFKLSEILDLVRSRRDSSPKT